MSKLHPAISKSKTVDIPVIITSGTPASGETTDYDMVNDYEYTTRNVDHEEEDASPLRIHNHFNVMLASSSIKYKLDKGLSLDSTCCAVNERGNSLASSSTSSSANSIQQQKYLTPPVSNVIYLDCVPLFSSAGTGSNASSSSDFSSRSNEH